MDSTARILSVRDAIAADINTQVATVGGGMTAASNAAPIQITTNAPHGLFNGATVTIAGAGGNTAANGTWQITVVDASNFTLTGSVGNGVYTTGGTWACVRFVAVGGYRTEYKLAELNLIRVDVKALPDFTPEEESRGGTRGSVRDSYRFMITVQRIASIQKIAASAGVPSVDTMINLAVRIGKLYPPSSTILGTALVTANEQQIYDDNCLISEGYFKSTILLTVQEYADD